MTSSKPLSYEHRFVLEVQQCKLILIQPLCRSAPEPDSRPRAQVGARLAQQTWKIFGLPACASAAENYEHR
jgi:hypothetical protein